jgi:predicted amidohydrolase YtcJ
MHATSDKNMAQDRLGEVRILGTCAWRKLLDTGVIIANGSDFPVEPGKKADFSLLDQDIFAVEPTENWNTAVSKTWVGGRLVSEAQAQ